MSKYVLTYRCDCGEDFYEDDNLCINCGTPIEKPKLVKQEVADIKIIK